VEVSIAVMILAIAITTALAAMQRAFLQLDTARNLQLAGSILQCEMEKHRLLPWERVSDPAYQPVIDSSFLRNPAVAGRFTLSRSLAVVPERNGQLVHVTLTVTWRTFDGRNLSRSYTTTFCQGGLFNRIYHNV
jgi:Tfp pilus assembly protein PilV